MKTLIKIIATLSILAVSNFVFASQCTQSPLIITEDKNAVYQTFYEDEKLLHYVFYADGDLIIFEHQFCFMDDYQIDYFSKKLDEEKVQARLAEFISSISAKHHLKIKTDFFSPILATGGADHHFYSANSENVEVSRALEKADFRVLPENFSLYIGIGGMH
ncbi:hypothetical protein [Vibrio nigripulchritudo]|uniref:hypothetical protein n=1 Tax=Vibrio nigripulchritudo TaxID=28173 RepID=UPI0003B200B0|nr:hypothetical protein [Vibrio nigripulchritudo]CCN69135.1 exported hypothetical protein [Vibrio nigripulchritudo SFn118]